MSTYDGLPFHRGDKRDCSVSFGARAADSNIVLQYAVVIDAGDARHCAVLAYGASKETLSPEPKGACLAKRPHHIVRASAYKDTQPTYDD